MPHLVSGHGPIRRCQNEGAHVFASLQLPGCTKNFCDCRLQFGHPFPSRSPSQLLVLLERGHVSWGEKTNPRERQQAGGGGGLHEMGKGSVRAAIASEGYLWDVEVRLHHVHVHDQVFITKNDEHVEEISMKQ